MVIFYGTFFSVELIEPRMLLISQSNFLSADLAHLQCLRHCFITEENYFSLFLDNLEEKLHCLNQTWSLTLLFVLHINLMDLVS